MTDLTYLTDHYDKKIERINEIGAPLNFIFITDMHNRLREFCEPWSDKKGFELAVNAVNSMQYIIDRCPIDCVVNGGDTGNDYDFDPKKFYASHEEISDALYNLSVPAHNLIGNHDDGIGTAKDRGNKVDDFAILPQKLHKLYMKNNPTDKNYYYHNFDDKGFRFVFLNTSDLPYVKDENGEYFFHWRLEISNEQAIWFEEEALKTGKNIIVFSHAPIHTAGIVGSLGSPKCINPYDDVLNAPRVYYNIKKSENVVATISGHVHYDNLLYDDNMLTVTTASAFADYFLPTCPKREYKTYTETAFDVFSIKDNVMYITRFGAGEDRIAPILR